MTSVTCACLIEESLPDLQCSINEYRTLGPSLSSGANFNGTVLDWDNLDKEVENYIYHGPLNRRPPARVLLHRPPNQSHAFIEREEYLCGEEKGIEGRFNHQVMHILQHAANASDLPVRLGDFRATSDYKDMPRKQTRLPDLACMARNGVPFQQAKFFGECKADWGDDILVGYSQTDRLRNMKRWIKQIAEYLLYFKLAYGFVTTYRHTVFIYFPHFATEEHSSANTLYISRPIPHSQAYQSSTSTPQNSQPPRVSVRQVLWYLMVKARDEPDTMKMTEDKGALTQSGLRSDKSGDGLEPAGAKKTRNPKNLGKENRPSAGNLGAQVGKKTGKAPSSDPKSVPAAKKPQNHGSNSPHTQPNKQSPSSGRNGIAHDQPTDRSKPGDAGDGGRVSSSHPAPSGVSAGRKHSKPGRTPIDKPAGTGQMGLQDRTNHQTRKGVTGSQEQSDKRSLPTQMTQKTPKAPEKSRSNVVKRSGPHQTTRPQ